MKPLLVSSGEPAGIGPDLCVALAEYELPVVVLADLGLLKSRARELNKNVHFIEYESGKPVVINSGCLTVFPVNCGVPVVSGQLNPENAGYVLQLLTTAAQLCAKEEFAALVTAPVHKANINAAGISFTGHTEFFAEFYQAETVVMMLACTEMRVALITTHLPLREVAAAINPELIIKVITQLHASLVNDFGIAQPLIKVAGLNPHAGESGYLGSEEIEMISPALETIKKKGINVQGPFPADTMFTKSTQNSCDAYVAMYHDQGLAVLKYVGFNQSVNITLGLPIIRTSVDHGTALELAGTGKADCGSLLNAVYQAQTMALNRLKLWL